MNIKCKKCKKDLITTNSILNVKPESDSSKLGLKKGDCICSINGISIKQGKDLEKINKLHSITIQRKEKKITFNIENIKSFKDDIKFKENSVIISEVKANSEFSKLGILPEDILLSIDSIKISKNEEIPDIPHKEYNIEIIRKGENKKIKTTKLDKILENITLKPEDICSSCGTKQKTNFFPLFIIIGILLIIGIFAIILINKKNIQNEPKKTEKNEVIASEIEPSSPLIPVSVIETEVLPKTTLELLEKKLKETSSFTENNKNFNKSESLEMQTRKRSGLNRSEVFFAYDESGNVLNLRDTYLGSIDLNDGITFYSNSRNQTGETTKTETRTRTRRASNRTQTDFDSIENTLNTITELKDTIIEMADISDISEKIIGRVYFDYGSSLEPAKMNLSIEKYLLINKQSEELKEYSSIVLGLNDLINKIPQDKKDSAVFILLGHADTTLFNAIPEISERSNKFNTELSLKRAETVKAILTDKSFKIDSNKIITQGLGYSKNKDAVFDLWKYRRVDIVISYE